MSPNGQMRQGIFGPVHGLKMRPAHRSPTCKNFGELMDLECQRRNLSGPEDASMPLRRKLVVAGPATPRTRLRMQAAAD
jgi:hypothetical protein